MTTEHCASLNMWRKQAVAFLSLSAISDTISAFRSRAPLYFGMLLDDLYNMSKILIRIRSFLIYLFNLNLSQWTQSGLCSYKKGIV